MPSRCPRASTNTTMHIGLEIAHIRYLRGLEQSLRIAVETRSANAVRRIMHPYYYPYKYMIVLV